MADRDGVVNWTWDGFVPPECHLKPRILRLNPKLMREDAHESVHEDNNTHRRSGVPPAYYAHLVAFGSRYYFKGGELSSSRSATGRDMATREKNLEVRSLPAIKDMRCTRSFFIVPPAYYPHLAAFHSRYFFKGGELSDCGSASGRDTATREKNLRFAHCLQSRI
ncbi:Hypothetical predicted protein [Olea europaea subsp. europaea]|uniref:Sialate O-acetylesterase domain-containing protein n=1 Tax=Olea europaea subsp. europaea TaxID=158383 RepID=A0A8S0TII9_OLEEU|nr:Hypothetical predicted protein [Olea europaea subsp. europaea]